MHAHHGLGGLEDEVSQLLQLHGLLERQLQLAAGDDDVREVQQMHLQQQPRSTQFQNERWRLMMGTGESRHHGGVTGLRCVAKG